MTKPDATQIVSVAGAKAQLRSLLDALQTGVDVVSTQPGRWHG